ncbi:MAG: hypothetical protein RR211_02270 [Pseudoflavonifractor sp.]
MLRIVIEFLLNAATILFFFAIFLGALCLFLFVAVLIPFSIYCKVREVIFKKTVEINFCTGKKTKIVAVCAALIMIAVFIGIIYWSNNRDIPLIGVAVKTVETLVVSSIIGCAAFAITAGVGRLIIGAVERLAERFVELKESPKKAFERSIIPYIAGGIAFLGVVGGAII